MGIVSKSGALLTFIALFSVIWAGGLRRIDPRYDPATRNFKMGPSRGLLGLVSLRLRIGCISDCTDSLREACHQLNKAQERFEQGDLDVDILGDRGGAGKWGVAGTGVNIPVEIQAEDISLVLNPEQPSPAALAIPTFTNCSHDEDLIKEIEEIVREELDVCCIPDILNGRNMSLVIRQDGHPWKLGEGTFGQVFLGKLQHHGQSHLVAIKCIKVSSQEAQLDDVVAEAAMGLYCWSSAGQGVVPRCFGLVGIEGLYNGEKFGKMAIVSQFVGDPKTYKVWPMDALLMRERLRLSKGLRPVIPVTGWIGILETVARKVARMHHTDVYIQDLKGDNVILVKTEDGSFDPVLIDLGCASMWEVDPTSEPKCSHEELKLKMAALKQIAPEYFLYGQVGPAGDVYSLGNLIQQVKKSFGISMDYLDDLISQCSEMDGSSRPDISRVAYTLRNAKALAAAEGYDVFY